MDHTIRWLERTGCPGRAQLHRAVVRMNAETLETLGGVMVKESLEICRGDLVTSTRDWRSGGGDAVEAQHLQARET